MFHPVQAILSVFGRLCLVTIFLMSAVGKKIPDYAGTVAYMEQHSVPVPQVSLGLAIAFLLLGGLSVLLGYHARLGAALLAVFLVLATYYFHPAWEDQKHMIDAMKNLGLLGAMLFIVANGPGAGSLGARRR